MNNRIKEARERAGFSQGDLAKKMKMKTRQTISSYERGQTQPNVKQWEQLSQILEAPVPYLQGYDLTDDDWAQYDSEGRADEQDKSENRADQERLFVAETIDDFRKNGNYSEISDIARYTRTIRESALNKYRINISKDKTVLNVDPFSDWDNERRKNIKNPYMLYIGGTDAANVKLHDIIEKTRGKIAPEETATLESVLRELNSDFYRV